MTRAALYARYSSDQQSASSIDDQLRICREQAARDGWQMVAVYKDAAISGASVTLRPGIQSLLQDAQAGKFDVIVAEALDRVSRDQADVATLPQDSSAQHKESNRGRRTAANQEQVSANRAGHGGD